MQRAKPYASSPSVVAANCRALGMTVPSVAFGFLDRSGTKLTDYSGWGRHGTTSGMPTTAWNTAGDTGPALQFDGSDDSVPFGTTQFITTGKPWTIHARVNLSSYSNYPCICRLKTEDATSGFELGLSANGGYVGIRCGSGFGGTWANAGTPTSPTAGSWFDLIVTYNGLTSSTYTNFNFYVNGVLQTQDHKSIYSLITNTNDLGVGGTFWTGGMSQFEVWSDVCATSAQAARIARDPGQIYRRRAPPPQTKRNAVATTAYRGMFAG